MFTLLLCIRTAAIVALVIVWYKFLQSSIIKIHCPEWNMILKSEKLWENFVEKEYKPLFIIKHINSNFLSSLLDC